MEVGVRPYKVESIHIPMYLDKLVDVAVDHPFRYHREMVIAHCHPQQWKNVRVAEALPCYNFLAEPLCNQSAPLDTLSRTLADDPRQ